MLEVACRVVKDRVDNGPMMIAMGGCCGRSAWNAGDHASVVIASGGHRLCDVGRQQRLEVIACSGNTVRTSRVSSRIHDVAVVQRRCFVGSQLVCRVRLSQQNRAIQQESKIVFPITPRRRNCIPTGS